MHLDGTSEFVQDTLFTTAESVGDDQLNTLKTPTSSADNSDETCDRISDGQDQIRDAMMEVFLRFHIDAIPAKMKQLGISPSDLGYENQMEVLRFWAKKLPDEALERGYFDLHAILETLETYLLDSKKIILEARQAIHENDAPADMHGPLTLKIREELIEAPVQQKRAPRTNSVIIKESVTRFILQMRAAML